MCLVVAPSSMQKKHFNDDLTQTSAGNVYYSTTCNSVTLNWKKEGEKVPRQREGVKLTPPSN